MYTDSVANNKIRVLYVSPFSRIGGGEMSILTVMDNLDRHRFHPILVCYEDGPFVERAIGHGIETRVFRRTGFISELSIIWKLIRFIRKNDIRLMHVNSLDIRAALAARLAGIPFIGHLRVVFPLTWRDFLFTKLSMVTIAVSKAVVEEFCKSSEACRRKFIIIPNVVDMPEVVSAAPLRYEFNIPKEAPLVGMAGRLDPFKGHAVFVDAAALIRKSVERVKFLIIGDASPERRDGKIYLEALKKRIEELGLEDSFVFTGFRDDVLSVIAALDVFVVPSLVIKKGIHDITEGFGRVAIEAMAVGVPVVTSDAGGLKEIIEPGVSGILVPMNDPAAIAEGVVALLRDWRMADAIRAAAKKRFDAFYSVKALDKLYELYRQVAK